MHAVLLDLDLWVRFKYTIQNHRAQTIKSNHEANNVLISVIIIINVIAIIEGVSFSVFQRCLVDRLS